MKPNIGNNMKITRLIAVRLAGCVILGLASGWQVFAATTLSLNPLGEMVVADASGQTVKTLVMGSVGEVVRIGADSFKISYGKDLQGRATAILYANPENPQPFAVSCQSQELTVSKEAVLTIVLDGNGALVQSGILGQVTVGGQQLAPQETLRISNSGTIVADTPAPAKPSADKLAVPAVVAKPVVPRGPIEVGPVTGRVFIDTDGKGEQPLTGDSVVKIGSVIRTEKNSAAVLELFPDVTATLYQDSVLLIREYVYTPGDAPDRKFTGVLTKGKLHNSLNVKGRGQTDYKIETPHQIFSAIGTDFLVTISEEENTAFVQVYEGVVGASDGTKIHAMVQGLYASTGQPPEFTPMSSQELRVAEERRRGRDAAAGEIADGALPSQSYAQTPVGRELAEIIRRPTRSQPQQGLDSLLNQTQGVFKPRLTQDPITPTGPSSQP
jgi:hypothetical protein